jgi:hypothetical protein
MTPNNHSTPLTHRAPLWLALWVSVAALAAGCVTNAPTPAAPVVAAAPAKPAPAPTPAPTPVPPPAVLVSAGAGALNDGASAFQLGEYRRAETKLLESQKLGLNQSAEQVRAHKTLAFMYCVTKRTAQCEKSFQAAFDLNRGFDLSRAERGHPVWGPVFVKVQKRQPK